MAIKVALTITDGVDAGKSFEFTEGSITIGRGRCQFVITDKKASGSHCRISIDGNEAYIEDLNSTNGTFIGGRRISQKQTLENLDEIILGLSKISVAIIEQISEFKARNQVSSVTFSDDSSLEVLAPIDDDALDLEPVSDDEPPTRVKAESALIDDPSKSESNSKEIELPPPDAVYRETGIRRIEDLIEDEMEAFSKWDHPAMPEGQTSTGRIGVPKIKVSLNLRRSPDGGINAVCTQPVTTLGRKDVDIRVNDLDCSRKHSAIEIVAGEKAFVRDLASTNGTYVNGKRIAYQELKNGDLLQIGQTIYEVTIERGG